MEACFAPGRHGYKLPIGTAVTLFACSGSSTTGFRDLGTVKEYVRKAWGFSLCDRSCLIGIALREFANCELRCIAFLLYIALAVIIAMMIAHAPILHAHAPRRVPHTSERTSAPGSSSIRRSPPRISFLVPAPYWRNLQPAAVLCGAWRGCRALSSGSSFACAFSSDSISSGVEPCGTFRSI
jgi:hypothetical protein